MELIIETYDTSRRPYHQLESIECVALRAAQYSGRGDGKIWYEAKDASGTWRTMLKKDQKQSVLKKLPVANQLEWGNWKIIDKRPTHRVEKRETVEYPLEATIL